MKLTLITFALLILTLACQQKERIGPPGRDGIDGIDGEVGEPGQDAIAELINPCGASTSIDEVLIRLNDGRLLAYFEAGGRRFLAVIPPGDYVTTDSDACQFTVDAVGNVTDELGNVWTH